MKSPIILMLIGVLLSCSTPAKRRDPALIFPDQKQVKLIPWASLENKKINECSGITKSKSHRNIYWVHNDSGDKARIFPVNMTKDGGEKIGKEDGLNLEEAKHNDWEDITTDDEGNIYVADLGNNHNSRKSLTIYKIEEPKDLNIDLSKKKWDKYKVKYPKEEDLPEKVVDFDCEALFHFNGHLYILTKNRSNRGTDLYRFDQLDKNKTNRPTYLDFFNTENLVTGADISPNGKKLVVLTYTAVWIFEDFKEDKFFEGKISWLPIRAGQCEAICFVNNNELIITNETRQLYKLNCKDLLEIKRKETAEL